jgi:hypothetical protein
MRAALIAILLGGCGGSSGAPEDMAAPADFSMTLPDLAAPDLLEVATHSINIGIAELHTPPTDGGTTYMVPYAAVGISPLSDVPDKDNRNQIGVGCTASEYNTSGSGTGHPPTVGGDVGTVTITGYSGRGNATTTIPATLTCAIDATDPYKGYNCAGLPDAAKMQLVTDPAHFVALGDMVRFQASGGAASLGAPIDVTVPATGRLTIENAAALSSLDPSQALTITIDCIDGSGAIEQCNGVVLLTVIASNGTATVPRTHWANIACTTLALSQTSVSIDVPQPFMQLAANTPWHSLLVAAVRLGQPIPPSVDLPNHKIFIAGQGELVANFR